VNLVRCLLLAQSGNFSIEFRCPLLGVKRTCAATSQFAGWTLASRWFPGAERTDVRYPANTMEDMRKLLLGYRDNMRVEVESGVAVKAKTVADLRTLPTWPGGLILDIHVDLDPRSSVVRVERAS
jgi:hypothetical protein